MGQKAYFLPAESEAELGPWMPCKPSQLMAGDLVRVRELVPLDKGTPLTNPAKETLSLGGHIRTVYRQVIKLTVVRVRRVTKDLVLGSPVSIHVHGVAMPLPRQDVFRVYRNSKETHLKDFARHRDEGPVDRDVDPVAHSVRANCERYLALLEDAMKLGLTIGDVGQGIASIREDDRYGDPMPDSSTIMSWLNGKTEPPGWVWKHTKTVIDHPASFRMGS